jgi:hypothetical protein
MGAIRRRNGLVKRFRGHILVIEPHPDRVTVDCMLRADDDEPVLLTLSFSVPANARGRVLDVLGAWEARDDTVDVMLTDGRRGPQVEIHSGGGKLVLSRSD